MFQIQTPLGVYAPTPVIKGGEGSRNHLQAATQDTLSVCVANILLSMDDYLLLSKTESQLLGGIEAFIRVCHQTGFELHPEGTDFCLHWARFYGQLITFNGVRHDSKDL